MLISVILTFNEENDVVDALNRLASRQGTYEVIVVNSSETNKPLTLTESQARVVNTSAVTFGAQFDAGATAATGEVLFFLSARQQLPDDALPAIHRNFELLPQTVGGNFHLKFNPSTLFAKLLVHFLKWWRYRGSYSAYSGLFVRRDVYQTIGGFGPRTNLIGYDFSHRLEKYGPTLFLPETIVMPMPPFSEALAWIAAPILAKLS